MSKWMKNKEKIFSQFKEQKKQENETQSAGPRRSDIVWKTPEKGTQDKPKVYQVRLLPDQNDNFYKTFHYHMFKSNSGSNKWTFVLCPKTWDFNNYCPLCAATMRLYKGSKEDKKAGYNYKRKRKHCSNVFVVKDPRDVEATEEKDQNNGKVLVYEFPDKVESKIKEEMMDDEYGNGIGIFDPGEDGVDFILKVGSTKPIQEEGPNKGKTYPDYSDSKFANKSMAILDNDEKIEEIMNSTHNLDEYLGAMSRTQEELIQFVKDEMLWDLISEDFPDQTKQEPKTPQAPNEPQVDDAPDYPFPSNESESSNEKKKDTEEDISDDDLLSALDDL